MMTGIYKGLEPPCGFEKVNERWEVGVGLSDGTFQQVSFVNSICTMKGGCHVAYIADQVATRLAAVSVRSYYACTISILLTYCIHCYHMFTYISYIPFLVTYTVNIYTIQHNTIQIHTFTYSPYTYL